MQGNGSTSLGVLRQTAGLSGTAGGVAGFPSFLFQTLYVLEILCLIL